MGRRGINDRNIESNDRRPPPETARSPGRNRCRRRSPNHTCLFFCGSFWGQFRGIPIHHGPRHRRPRQARARRRSSHPSMRNARSTRTAPSPRIRSNPARRVRNAGCTPTPRSRPSLWGPERGRHPHPQRMSTTRQRPAPGTTDPGPRRRLGTRWGLSAGRESTPLGGDAAATSFHHWPFSQLESSGSGKAARGFGVMRQRYSWMPPQSCTARMPKMENTNISSTITLPRAGIDASSVLISCRRAGSVDSVRSGLPGRLAFRGVERSEMRRFVPYRARSGGDLMRAATSLSARSATVTQALAPGSCAARTWTGTQGLS